ncbi:type II secretion system F family protein [Bacillus alkalicellulosilyticus]|uniref:type II secretion system F family protein n=1 Tax=Alkalihalobacterium alkalicellulosilyticum TaxID=1912214 RepID=UPI000997A5AE|nr:type II secretion system F family protein [Bacillus alkalicellulosilyticus]
MKPHEFIFYALIAALFFFAIAFIFYKSIIACLIFASLGLLYPKFKKRDLIKKRKHMLSQQFQQALFSLSSSLVAGRSIENAFLEVSKDLELLYPDPDTFIIKEFEMINRRVENRESIESAIKDFSQRAGIEDITNFTEVFVTCKRTGGDLVEVIRRTANIISEKIEIQQEIAVMVSQKKFESNALSVAPLIMVALLAYTSGEYMAPLYSWSDAGPIVMTVCLAMIVFSYWVSKRIMDIKV